MKHKVELDSIYRPSEDIVAREVQGEFIIIPIASGVGDSEDEIFSLDETGRAIWDKLDGKRTLQDVIKELSSEFESLPLEIKEDVEGLVGELLKRRMVVVA